MKSVVCSLHFTLSLSFTLSLHFTPVCSPQSAFYTDDFQFDCQQSGSEIGTSLYVTKLHRPSKNIRPYRPFHKITTESFKYIEQLNCWNFVSSIISTE